MATTYNVGTGTDDWDHGSVVGFRYTGATIIAEDAKAFTPNTYRTAFADVDTSGIPDTDVISAASVLFDESAYIASRGLAKTYNLYMWTGSTWVFLEAFTFVTAAIRTHTLTATERGYISKTGKTKFRWIISGAVASGEYKTLSIKAYETSQAVACRMSITHAPASGGTPQRTLLGVGL